MSWGWPNYDGKKVLDLGAGDCEMARYFRDRGADFVVAVDDNSKKYSEMKLHPDQIKWIFPIMMVIDSPGIIEKLIDDWKPDIVKSDIDGNERFFYGVDFYVLQKVSEYIIKCHTKEVLSELIGYFDDGGFEVENLDDKYLVHFKKKDVA